MENKYDKILDALIDFVLRVSKGPATEEELAVLPQIAELCLGSASYEDTASITFNPR